MNLEQPVINIGPQFFEKISGTRLVWLGMAGILVNSRGTILMVDPLLSTVDQAGKVTSEAGFPLDHPLPVTAPEIPRVDGVCYTHADGDHLGRLTALTLSNQLACRFVAPPPVATILRETGIAEQRITTIHDFDRLQFGPVQVIVTPALHDWQEIDPWQRGDCCGYLFRTPDGSIWHPGDTRLIDDLLEIKDVDVLLFDVAAVDSHLGPAGSTQLAKTCGAKVMIAYHYWPFGQSPGDFATLNPHTLQASMQDLKTPLRMLKPGEVLELP